MNDKTKQYQTLSAQVAALVSGETDEVGVLANVAAALKETFPERFFWVGFYLIKRKSPIPSGAIATPPPSGEGWEVAAKRELECLRLGPFQGPVACYAIPYGKGVCGSAWKEQRTLVVPDVEQFPGHIACSSLSRSEIVVPVFSGGGEVVAVLDIDSRDLNTFDDLDRQYLEPIAALVSAQVSSWG